MTARPLMLPANRAFDNDGAPIAEAKAFLYNSGTTTPALFYEDAGLTVSLGSSITANAAGRFDPLPYQDSSIAFRLIIQDALGAVIEDIDPFYFGQQIYDIAGSVFALTRSALALVSGTANAAVYLTEGGREGQFIWSATNHATDVTNDPQQGVYVPPATDITGASGAWVRMPTAKIINPYFFGATGGYNSYATAYTGIDDTVAVQAMFTFWKNNPEFIPDLQGKYWTVSSEITVRQIVDGLVERTSQKAYGGTLVQKSGGAALTRLLTINAAGVHFAGHWGAIGAGSADGNCINYANRLLDYGIYIVDSACMRMDSWYAANTKCWGLDTATEDFANLGNRSNNNGSNIGLWIGPGNAWNCGSAANQSNSSRLQYTINTVTFNGATAASSQTTTISFTAPIDSKIAVGDIFTYDEFVATLAGAAITNGSATVTVASASGITIGDYVSGTGIPANTQVQAIVSATQITLSNNATATNASVTLTVTKRTCYTIKTLNPGGDPNGLEFYFWLPSTAAAGQTMDSAHGGLLHIHGINSGVSRFGRVEGLRAGVGCKDSGLYGATVGDIHTEASGICHVTGNPPNVACYGGSTETMHCESTYLMLVHRGITPMSRLIGPQSASGSGLQPSASGVMRQFYHQRPRYSDDKLSNYGTSGLILSDGNGAMLENEAGPANYEAAISTVTISNRPSERYFKQAFSTATTPTVTMNWYDGYNEGWTGKNWMGFEFVGAGGGRNSVNQITVQLDPGLIGAGWTLNGGTTSIVYTNMKGPCRGMAVVDVRNKNFRFTLTDVQPQGLDGSEQQANAAKTLVAGTNKRFQIWDVPLTANRAVTLSTTNVKDGDVFEIVRTANSTGAFTLDVGTGPLKSLATSQWCKVIYDGTAAAWRLMAFGAL